LELLSAALLSLATVASTWCAYQSARWNGVQAMRYGAADRARSESVRMSNAALQMVSIDVATYLEYAAAYADGNEFLMDFIGERFRPEMRTAMDAWLATRPLTNPEAPATPFEMTEYRLATLAESDQLLEEADQQLAEAGVANTRSANYVLLTVLFASVLFFAGITTKFETFSIEVALLAIAAIIFAGTLVLMATYPLG